MPSNIENRFTAYLIKALEGTQLRYRSKKNNNANRNTFRTKHSRIFDRPQFSRKLYLGY